MLRGVASLCLLATALAAAADRAGPAGFNSKPHIFTVVVDDLGWNNVGWHNKEMQTPNADALAKEGIILDKSYVFMYCAPTRSSIMSGRLPFRVNQVLTGMQNPDWDMPSEMTAIPKKLKLGGYATHMVGKWHVGVQSVGQTPFGRGFDTSKHYADGAEDHWTQAACCCAACNCPCTAESDPGNGYAYLQAAGLSSTNMIDFWCTDKPCWGLNGTNYHMGRNGQVVGDIKHYGDYVYSQEAIRIINEHDLQIPIYFYIAFQCNHEPLEAPDEFVERYPASYRVDRRWYAGMTSYWDAALGNITDVIKARGMWNDSIMVLTTDNGGPAYWTTPKVQYDFPPLVPGAKKGYPHGGGANNWPLKGSKVSLWEGGTRGASFVTGGLIPETLRGTTQMEKLHVADWFATFCYLAGVDPEDPNLVHTTSDGTKYPMPGIDSINLWGFISGVEKTSPRTEVPICIDMPLMNGTSALIVGDYKLLLGHQNLAFWQGPSFPNASGCPAGTPDNRCFDMYAGANFTEECGTVDCPAGVPGCPTGGSVASGGCLFNLRTDPHETRDLAKELPDVLNSLRARYLELKKTGINQRTPLSRMAYNTKRLAPNFVQMLQRNKGFVGPWCTDGACAPASTFVNLSYHEGEFIKLPYGQGGEFEGMPPFKPYHESL